MIHKLLTVKEGDYVEYLTLVAETPSDIDYLIEMLGSGCDVETITEKEAIEIEDSNLQFRNVRNRYQFYKGLVSNY
jgi:chromosome segregation and condensation protein ScpB